MQEERVAQLLLPLLRAKEGRGRSLPSWNSPPWGVAVISCHHTTFAKAVIVAFCNLPAISYGEAVRLRYAIPYRTFISAYFFRSETVRINLHMIRIQLLFCSPARERVFYNGVYAMDAQQFDHDSPQR